MSVFFRKTTPKILQASLLVVTAVVVSLLGNSLTVAAYTRYDRRDAIRGTPFFNLEEAATCAADTSLGSEGALESNKDYAGNVIFGQAQLDAINNNKKVYQEAAGDALPWQMLAVVHMRETGLKRANPGNGQGVYQFADGHGGPYPTGPVSDEEFLRQTKLAVDFLIGKLAANYPNNRALGKTPAIAAVKDTFFSYNGRAGVYADQAARLGFDRNNEGYEGSPYVMNRADERRDPFKSAPGTWGQVKRDYGPIEYPANSDYGAFVQYGAIAGISTTGGCDPTKPVDCSNFEGDMSNSTLRRNVVCLAQQELDLWKSGTLKPNTFAFHKYSQGRSENWCADFVSWIYFKAGYPFDPATNKDGNIAYVPNIQAMGEKDQKFFWHSTAHGYVPKPGDLVIYGGDHVNLVIAVEGTKVTTIGGNQGGNGSQPFYAGSSVTQYDVTNGKEMTGYVSPEKAGTGGGLQPI